MTPEEMILTLRICGNHPEYESFTCEDCPWAPHCDNDGGGAGLSLRAAHIIQELMEENEKLKAAARALDAILEGT